MDYSVAGHFFMLDKVLFFFFSYQIHAFWIYSNCCSLYNHLLVVLDLSIRKDVVAIAKWYQVSLMHFNENILTCLSFSAVMPESSILSWSCVFNDKSGGILIVTTKIYVHPVMARHAFVY